MAVSRDEVQHIARLARLRFSDEEERQMARELDQILDYVGKLDELDTSGVPPMTHVLDITNVFRPDEVKAELDAEDALEEAPAVADRHVRVPGFMHEKNNPEESDAAPDEEMPGQEVGDSNTDGTVRDAEDTDEDRAPASTAVPDPDDQPDSSAKAS